MNSVDSLAIQFGISKKATREIVDFLLQHGLCINKDGKLTMGVQSTHLTPESPFLLSHHRNWRIKALEKMSKNFSDDLFYSGPMSLSKDLASDIRKNILALVESTVKKVIPSPSEELMCLNVDWFRV